MKDAGRGGGVRVKTCVSRFWRRMCVIVRAGVPSFTMSAEFGGLPVTVNRSSDDRELGGMGVIEWAEEGR